MSHNRQVKIIGGPPEFWILPGVWKRHRAAFTIVAILSTLTLVAIVELVKVRPATVQFLHNDKLISDLEVDWPDEESFRFDSDTATLEVIHFRDDRRQSVFVSSSVLNMALTVTSGEHQVIHHYESPKTGRTATITQTTRKFPGVFETIETKETVSLADSDVANGVARNTPTSVLISQIKKEALGTPEELSSEKTADAKEGPQ